MKNQMKKPVFLVVSGKATAQLKRKRSYGVTLMVEGTTQFFSTMNVPLAREDFDQIEVGDRFELVKVPS